MRKRRTRQHFVSDLGVNFVEKQCLLGRCTYQRIDYDYGFDGEISTYRGNGEIEKGEIKVQVKSTDKIKLSTKQNGYVIDLSVRDLELWLSYLFPVILVLYDAKSDQGYYINVPDYFKNKKHHKAKDRKFVRVYLPVDNIFEPAAVQKLRKDKNLKYESFERL